MTHETGSNLYFLTTFISYNKVTPAGAYYYSFTVNKQFPSNWLFVEPILLLKVFFLDLSFKLKFELLFKTRDFYIIQKTFKGLHFGRISKFL